MRENPDRGRDVLEELNEDPRGLEMLPEKHLFTKRESGESQ